MRLRKFRLRCIQGLHHALRNTGFAVCDLGTSAMAKETWESDEARTAGGVRITRAPHPSRGMNG